MCLPSLECCATKARLSIAFRNEGDGSSLERPEPNSERDGQVSTKNGAVWERGRIRSARRCDWKHSLNWSRMCVWELPLQSLGFLNISCRAKNLLKNGFGETKVYIKVARIGLACCYSRTRSHLVNVLYPDVISNTRERNRTIHFSEANAFTSLSAWQLCLSGHLEKVRLPYRVGLALAFFLNSCWRTFFWDGTLFKGGPGQALLCYFMAEQGQDLKRPMFRLKTVSFQNKSPWAVTLEMKLWICLRVN